MKQGKFGYYLDFALVPFLVCAALIAEVYYQGPRPVMAATAALGFLVWTFLEYWIHRVLFHHVFARQHWLHHKRPASFGVTIPGWQTFLVQAVVYGGCVAAFGLPAGTGLFVGLEAGYLSYIITHDAIHHRKHKAFGWLRSKWEHHVLHHNGLEVNFGVVSQFWDRVFRTYRNPREGGTFLARRFRG